MEQGSFSTIASVEGKIIFTFPQLIKHHVTDEKQTHLSF